MKTKLKTTWKVLRKTKKDYGSSTVDEGVFSLKYKIKKKTVAPLERAPIFCFRTREAARKFKTCHDFGSSLFVFKCLGEPSKVVLRGICNFVSICDLNDVSKYPSQNEAYFIPPSETVYFKSITPIKKD